MMRFFDIVCSFLLICLALPLMFCIAVLIFCLNGRPVLYRAARIGRYGVPYTHMKFRTMRPGAETGRVFFEQDRLTRLGRMLRRLHLDELPELFLILRGTMSFTGPRPLPEHLLQGLDTSIRSRVRPGWTGPAQLYLVRRGILDKHLQIRLDNHYVHQQRFCYTIRLLAATLCVLFHPATPDMRADATEDRRRFEKRV